ncbi:MAG: alpha-1,6-glucosidase domain-containing protein [Candidatus Promineifilaceae bacterium]
MNSCKSGASSPLFRLQTAEDVQNRLVFYNTGPDQIPGLIVMSLSDMVGANLDPNYGMIVVLFNATPETQSFTLADVAGLTFSLHPVQQNSSDPVVQTASYNAANAAFTVPARTTAVFVLAEADVPVVAEPTEEAAAEPTQEPAAEPTEATVEEPVTEVTPETEAVETVEEPEPESNSTGLLVGLGVGAVALGGAAAYLARRRSAQ